LARQAADHNPQIAIPPLFAEAYDQFINFQGVVVDRRNERLL
jgi:hypothetical protein